MPKPNTLKRILKSVSSTSSKASSDRSYVDTYFDEIGFKMGDNSCLGSTESPGNLDGESILFYKEDEIFHESGDDEDNDEDIYIDEEKIEEHNYDQKSTTTATASNHYPSPQGGLKDMTLEQTNKEIMILPLDYVVHENPKRHTHISRSFKPFRNSRLTGDEEDFIYHDGNEDGDTKRSEYSPFRPHPNSQFGEKSESALGKNDRHNNKWENLDGALVGDKEFLHKTSSRSVEEYKERAFRVKATIWFLLFLGSFLLISAIVILVLADQQVRQKKLLQAGNNDMDVDLRDHDDNYLTPLAEGWELENEINYLWNRTTAAPTTSAPSQSPTTFLTTKQEELFTTLAFMDPNLSKGNLEKDSAQYRALQWLADDPFLPDYSAGRTLQRWVVATFYFSTNGDFWQIDLQDDQAIVRTAELVEIEDQFNTSPWMIPNTHECSWFTTRKTMICDGQGRLETLELENLQLKGSLPTEMGLLSILKHIKLPNNQIHGSMPHELAKLKHLQSLQLSGNKITGSIPNVFGHLTALESLKLQRNQISQTLPSELGNLEALKTFKANNNKLEGSIPVEYFSMFDLETLNLESNNLTGEIPTALAALPFLNEMTVQNNAMNGTIPLETCHLTGLIADCDEMICECCTQCCIGCQGTIGTIVETTIAIQAPTSSPSKLPTQAPTSSPSKLLTQAPTNSPSKLPTQAPTSSPSKLPTPEPTRRPTTNKPTSKPTKPPTIPPTSKPTSKPTKSPTSKPTRAPNTVTQPSLGPAPDGIHILISVGNDGLPKHLYPLNMCQGDCDIDNECKGDFVCYQRTGTARVPGCLGVGTSDRDYCTHPYFITGEMSPTSANPPTASPSANPIKEKGNKDKDNNK